jgi:argininosuccinate lyase
MSTDKDKQASNQMWGGRFASGPDAIMEEINASIDFDRKLYAQDIRGSLAHAAMLAKTGIISADDCDKITHGLNTILSEIEEGRFTFSRQLEDIHMNIESRLAELIGPAAGRLHTARSRNDQVALDFRLWVKAGTGPHRRSADGIDCRLSRQGRISTPTRSCRASPTCRPPSRSPSAITAWPMSRCSAATARGFATPSNGMDECPIGAAALAGTGFPIDRDMTAKELGFREPTRNSIDTVSDRDFALEFLSLASICAVHLSRLAEEIVIWSTPQFGLCAFPTPFPPARRSCRRRRIPMRPNWCAPRPAASTVR